MITYVDDILIMSEDAQSHYNHLEQVLKKFREHNMTVNLEKSKFFMKDHKEKIKTVEEFKNPKSKKDLQRYLGFINFYRKYIEKFEEIIVPLVQLLKKEVKWNGKIFIKRRSNNRRRHF